MFIKRCEKNPIISPKDVKPSMPGFKVDCAMNAAVTKFDGETLLLLRVAESVISDNPDIIKIPIVEEEIGNWKVVVKEINKKLESYDFSDSRVVRVKPGDRTVVYLTSLSHFRLARSSDGVNFKVDETPFMFPDTKYETFGMEDPRITLIEGRYYINYTAVSPIGVTTALAVTDDFKKVERLGIIFGPNNKDMCMFPEKVNGKYLALHRPTPKEIGTPDMWLAKSDNLLYWGDHEHFLGASNDDWDNFKLGGGAQVIKTSKGWLQIYHGVDSTQRYCLGAILMDLDDPIKIIAKSKKALLEPETDYEREGFFGNVVFTCGALIENNILKIYYGAADEVMALAEISMPDLWKHLGVKVKLQSEQKRVGELHLEFRDRLKNNKFSAKKLIFECVEGKDVYNITVPFNQNGKDIIAGRVESRDSEYSEVVFFEENNDKWYPVKGATRYKLQDPAISIIKNELVLSGVEVFDHPTLKDFLWYKTVFLKGKDIFSLEKFAEGPNGMKDIRFVDLNNKIGVFSRPQHPEGKVGSLGGRGTIAYSEIETLDNFNSNVIENAYHLSDQLHNEEWLGANEIHVLKNGLLGVLSHVAKFDEKQDRHYYSSVFVFDPKTKTHSTMKIIAERNMFEDGPSKAPDLKNVVFSGGLIRKENGKAILYVGTGDTEAQKIEIDDPFVEYELL